MTTADQVAAWKRAHPAAVKRHNREASRRYRARKRQVRHAIAAVVAEAIDQEAKDR